MSGLDGVTHVLRQLPKATGKRILRKIGIEALEPMAEQMRARAPRDRLDLVESITVGTRLSKSQRRFSGLNGGRPDPNIRVVHAGPGNMPQGVLQEIGTLHHEPSPFVTPAWEGGRVKALNYVTTNLRDTVMKSAKRAAKKGKLR